MRRTALLLLATTIVTGCGTVEEAPQPEWQLPAQAVTRIEDDGSDETIFQRIVDATRLPNGDVLVAEGRASELRLFAADGAFKRLVARKGAGPNELQSIRWLRRTSDTIFVGANGAQFVRYDPASLTELSRSGVSGPLRLGGAIVNGMLGNGHLLGARSAALRALAKPVTERTRDTARYSVSSEPMGALDLDLAPRLGSTGLMVEVPDSPFGFDAGRLEYGHHLLIAAAHNRLWFGDSGTGWIGYIDSRNGVVDSFPLPLSPQPWNDALIEEVRARLLREVPDPTKHALALAQLDPQWRPDVRPLYSALYADEQDGVWVELFREDERAPSQFLVLDADGRTVARVNAPTALRIFEIGADYVLGAEKDVDDVESVVVYRLSRQ